MKIRTITCHDVYNLGASLQAFALQHYLENQGYDVKLIDYKPDYLSGHFNLRAVNNPAFEKPLIRQLYILAKLPGRLMALPRKRAFDDFTKKYLNLTRRYNSYDELKTDAPEADVYIAGSDQIWNTLFRNGRDKAFYLDFGKREIKRISYAASFATRVVMPEYRDFVKKELQKFDAISIRESNSLHILKSSGRYDGVAVCDPVFLLSKQEWNDLLKKETGASITDGAKYILVYLTEESKEIKRIALKMKAETGWKIYVIGEFKEKYADKNFVSAGPFDLVSLIGKAQFVISNSFHATAFSIVMEKKFCAVRRSESINGRLTSILADYRLQNRMTEYYIPELLEDIDIKAIKEQKELIVRESKKWLASALES